MANNFEEIHSRYKLIKDEYLLHVKEHLNSYNSPGHKFFDLLTHYIGENIILVLN